MLYLYMLKEKTEIKICVCKGTNDIAKVH